MNLPAAITEAFPPDRTALFDLARTGIDTETLIGIASADYGFGSEVALPALQVIAGRGIIPSFFEFELQEALELTRRDNPHQVQPHWPEAEKSLAWRYRKRLLACTVLLLADYSEDIEYEDFGEDATWAQALNSTVHLGQEFDRALFQFLTWCFTPTRYFNQSPELFLALIIIAHRLDQQGGPDIAGSAAKFVIEVQASHRSRVPYDRGDPPPDLFGIQQGLWKPLVDEFLADVEERPPSETRDALELCSLLF